MADTSSISLAERVARGARLLDEKRPGWAREIATDRLAMESCDECILGQLFHDYADGIFMLKRDFPSTYIFRASHFGFTIPPREQDEAVERVGRAGAILELFKPLADLWRAEIARRLNSSPIPNGD